MSDLQKFSATAALGLLWAVTLMTVPTLPLIWIAAITTFILMLAIYAFFGVALSTPWRRWAPQALGAIVLVAFIYWLGKQHQLDWPGYILGVTATVVVAALFLSIAHAVVPSGQSQTQPAPSKTRNVRLIDLAREQGLVIDDGNYVPLKQRTSLAELAKEQGIWPKNRPSPPIEQVPLREAAIETFTALRNSLLGKMADREETEDDKVLWICHFLRDKLHIYGHRPPSSEPDLLDLDGYDFELGWDRAVFARERGGQRTLDRLAVRREQLEQLLRSYKE